MLKPEHKKLIQLITPYCTPDISTLLGSVNSDSTITLTIRGINIPNNKVGEISTGVLKLGGILSSEISDRDIFYYVSLTK